MSEINPVNNNSKGNENYKLQKRENSKITESLFNKLDTNKDKQISEDELIAAGYSGKELSAMKEAIFFAERNVNKWFSLDKTQDGQTDIAEMKMWNIHNSDGGHKIGDMTVEEFMRKNNLQYDPRFHGEDFETWCKGWIEDENPMCGIKAIAKERCGKELTDEETQLLYDVMKNQANRWLFKEPALYNRLNNDAYTRLATSEQTVSCCGGDIAKPPIGPQNSDESCSLIFRGLDAAGATNSSGEVKNRLAWAAFTTVPEDEVAKMTPEEYKQYQAEWQKVRDMKASDYRNLLKPENEAARKNFEATSNMTVQQIVDYIDIVESSTGKDYDSDDWSIDVNIFYEKIMPKLNGTYGDDVILQDKTRADIPPEKQEWLKYLEEHNLLLDQFKE